MNREISLALSGDPKPRLKWTAELHGRFVDAVNQLGGADKATPKSLRRAMAIPGLTLYHLKSHLQKYRLGKSQQLSFSCSDKEEEEYLENQRSHFSGETIDEFHKQTNESFQIAEALQTQMEVQRELYQQLEIQRHLQQRIEAQGKHLQAVLNRAQDTISRHGSFPGERELAKTELSQLVSMIQIGHPTSLNGNGCPLDSSLTLSENLDRSRQGFNGTKHRFNSNSVLHHLLELNQGDNSGNKRGLRRISDGDCMERQSDKRRARTDQVGDFGLLQTLDLNSHCLKDCDSENRNAIDLNCNGDRQFNQYL